MLNNLFVDYEYSLWGLPEGSKERERVKREVHSRSALKLQELCFRNGGIYIKLGQHISQLVCCYFSVTVYSRVLFLILDFINFPCFRNTWCLMNMYR